MQKLSFPLKIHVRRNGKRVIFVEHLHYGYGIPDTVRAQQDETRQFCKWLRTTFKDLPTEFRATKPAYYRHQRAQRHFVAYDVTPQEFMIIKLAFQFTTIPVVFKKKKKWMKHYWSDKRYLEEVYTPGYLMRCNVHPTEELLARMAKNPGKYRKLTRNRQKKD